jgi:hypothetical protein
MYEIWMKYESGRESFIYNDGKVLELTTEVVLEPMSPFSGRIEKFKDAEYFHDISMS